MKILVITRAPWKRDNGIGSTLMDFFSDFTDAEFYGLCLREAPSVSEICKQNFYISEGQLIQNLLHKCEVGRLTAEYQDTSAQENEEKVYNKAKRLNSTILQIAREVLWQTGTWKNKNLNQYLDTVKPDLIFFPDFPCLYAHKVLKYVQERTNAKVAIFHADDCYTLKQFSLSPLYWLLRFVQRRWVRNSVDLASFHYAISDVQKDDYDKIFHVNNKLLTKFGDFSAEPNYKSDFNHPIQIVYTGNIGLNRWKSLEMIVNALKELNELEVRAQLKIYTANEITGKIRRKLDVPGVSFLMGKATPEQMPEIQGDADILVHVEGLDLKNRLAVRQSFSTKIVDYLKRGRAILAVGPKEVASIKHLAENDCAIVADNSDELAEKLYAVLQDNTLLTGYAEKAYLCGKKHHNKEQMVSMLRNDLMRG